MSRYLKQSSRDWSRLRLILLWALFTLLWLALWAKAYQVQLIQGPDLANSADRQYWSKESAYGQRGEIVDRQGRLLAKSLTVKSVFARPSELGDPAHSAKTLARILDLQESLVLERLSSPRRFVWISRQIGDLQAFKINSAALPGIYLTEERRRFYPQGGLAGQVLGFVGLDNHGLEGLELYFDSYLAGQKSEYILQKDAAGNLLYAPGQFEQDISGRQLRLTLDARLQHAAEMALAGAVLKYKAKSGMSLVVEVKSGEILAWANYPFFNPNNYRSSQPEEMRNRVALEDFEPGSTLKPFLVAAALQEKVCTPNTIFFCEQGKWSRKGFEFNDVQEYGWLPVSKIIRYSSNIGAGKLGLELGAEKYYKYLQLLGLGAKTGLPLPSESPGVLRPPSSWSEVDLIAGSFGQGLSTTALQLAQAYLCLARKGVYTRLKIIKAPKDKIEQEHKRVFSTHTAEQILDMLKDVVQADGTGVKARIKGVSIGGKTGTSQKASLSGGYGAEHISAFVALIPALEPEYLILTIVDEPQGQSYGGLVAAPAVRDVALEVLSHSDQPQFKDADPRYGPLKKNTRGDNNLRFQVRKIGPDRQTSAVGPGQIPDLRGLSLRRAMEILASLGIVPEIRGHGEQVQKQLPSPGPAGLEVETNWVLWLEKGKG